MGPLSRRAFEDARFRVEELALAVSALADAAGAMTGACKQLAEDVQRWKREHPDEWVRLQALGESDVGPMAG